MPDLHHQIADQFTMSSLPLRGARKSWELGLWSRESGRTSLSGREIANGVPQLPPIWGMSRIGWTYSISYSFRMHQDQFAVSQSFEKLDKHITQYYLYRYAFWQQPYTRKHYYLTHNEDFCNSKWFMLSINCLNVGPTVELGWFI